LLLALALTALPFTAYAASEPRLQLSANKLQVKVGEKVTVRVLVENAPAIYGADVHLAFDPRLLEVLDADKKTEGIQVKPAKFLDPEDGFILQHHVDNEAGTIDYALTLLNPAPPAQGDGVLIQITFRGKADGLITIVISEGLFGTQTGKTIQAELDQISLAVGNALATTPTSAPTSTTVATPATTSGGMGGSSDFDLLALAGGLAAVGMVGVGGGGWFWLRRAGRR
jgi:hypothetical protein